MSFYVFVGTVAAIVHRGDCSHCNDGRGIRRLTQYSWTAAKRRQPVWLGPYVTAEDAMRHARSAESPKARLCQHCLPGATAQSDATLAAAGN